MEKRSKRLMTVEVHLMTLVISGSQEFVAKMRSSCSLGPVRTELAVRTLHSAVACEKKLIAQSQIICDVSAKDKTRVIRTKS